MLIIIENSNYSGLGLMICMVDYYKYSKKRVIERKLKKQKKKKFQEVINDFINRLYNP